MRLLGALALLQTIRWLTFATVADELNFDAGADSKDSYTAKT
jgi:DNA gyrase subunit B